MTNKTEKLITDITKEFKDHLEKYEAGEYTGKNLAAAIEYAENAIGFYAQEYNDKSFIESTLQMFEEADFEDEEQKVEALAQALSYRKNLL